MKLESGRSGRRRKGKRRFLALIVLALLAGAAFIWHDRQVSNPGADKNAAQQQRAQAGFDKQQYSLDDPSSIWVVVNKTRPLSPKTYAPDVVVPSIPLRSGSGSEEMHVSAQMAPSLEQLVNGAKQEGVNLMLASGYRSYDLQVSVYGSEVKNYGRAQADRESARPGTSEHQTGLAADLEPTSRKCEVQDCFADTPEGKWLAANAYKYGFILRYPQGKEPITGYRYEPWHIRYIGIDLATEMHKQNVQTLEEFFGLPAAPNYL